MIGLLLMGCRGQYSDAVLNELESQNEGQVEGILGKVKQLKDVSFYLGRSIHLRKGEVLNALRASNR